MPTAEKLAVVSTALMLPNVTVPGPLTLFQVVVMTLVGRPSSVTVPSRLTGAEVVTVRLAPALTTGGLLGDCTVMVVIALDVT